MKLLEEKYDGLEKFTELPNFLKMFLSDPTNQELLQKSDFKSLYRQAGDYSPQLTLLLNSLNIDPLNYLDYIPDGFLAYTSIKHIDIPDRITSIGRFAFSFCRDLTSIIIPDSVTSIDRYAFNSCTNLASIAIPNSLMSIRSSAFYECIRLTSIKYLGTKDQWYKINLVSGWDENSNIQTIHCKDGDINL